MVQQNKLECSTKKSSATYSLARAPLKKVTIIKGNQIVFWLNFLFFISVHIHMFRSPEVKSSTRKSEYGKGTHLQIKEIKKPEHQLDVRLQFLFIHTTVWIYGPRDLV